MAGIVSAILEVQSMLFVFHLIVCIGDVVEQKLVFGDLAFIALVN